MLVVTNDYLKRMSFVPPRDCRRALPAGMIHLWPLVPISQQLNRS